MRASPFRICLRRLALTLLVLANLSAVSLASGGEAEQDRQLRPVVDDSGLFLLAGDGKDGDSPAAAPSPGPSASLADSLVIAARSRPAQAHRLKVLSCPCKPQAPPRLT